ncbi:hypothetical protein CYMTET_47726 [Cymbomonas tetramitiformis]|uniref:Uncharacterized protein n=1 Tax=Cymbomonas tetramitiformis TaxID=36881 RepID=A0AAE0BTN9_9CHLO|nr:hypothetical protein CYMTET_47726 [Cymbomonas tetramitiformis]
MPSESERLPWWDRVWRIRIRALQNPRKYCGKILRMATKIRKASAISAEASGFLRAVYGCEEACGALTRDTRGCETWSDIELKAMLKRVLRAARCIRQRRPTRLQETGADVNRESEKSSEAPLTEERSPPRWLAILLGVEKLTTTNAAPIKRVVLEAIKLGAGKDISQSGMQRLEHAMTSLKKGGSYQFNNGRALKQTVLSVISTHTAAYSDPVVPISISSSQTRKKTVKRKGAPNLGDDETSELTDWKRTLGTVGGMVSNNSNPIKTRVRMAIRQAHAQPEIQEKLKGILKCTPCENNSCSMLKREVENVLLEANRAVPEKLIAPADSAKETDIPMETLSESSQPNGQAVQHVENALVEDTSASSTAECVYLAAVSGDGRHEYCIKCDHATMRKIFTFVRSLDTSECASQKFEDTKFEEAKL